MKFTDKAKLFIGMGVVAISLGAIDIFYPPQARPTGRWAFFLGPVFDAFGTFGVAILWIVIGVAAVFYGFLLGRER